MSKPIFVGQGLTEKTYEDCLALRINPNPNPTGEIHLPESREEMERDIIESQEFALRALKK